MCVAERGSRSVVCNALLLFLYKARKGSLVSQLIPSSTVARPSWHKLLECVSLTLLAMTAVSFITLNTLIAVK